MQQDTKRDYVKPELVKQLLRVVARCQRTAIQLSRIVDQRSA